VVLSIVVLLFLWISGCDAPLPDSTDAVEARSQSVSSSLKPAFLDTKPDLILTGPTESYTQYGNYPRFGDVNNDGYDDMVVGASAFNNKMGRVYLFYGGDPMDTTLDLTFDGENENDRFGRDISNPKRVGDVNGNGYGDLLISTRTWNYWAGVSGQGRAYLYYGGPGTSMDSIPDKVFTGENRRDDFGVSGCIFDIDDDGFDDVIIGVRSYNNRRGRVYLYWGGKDMDTIADKTFDGEADTQDSFGCGMDAGYVNDDDYGDIIVTAPYSNTGKAHLFYGDKKASIDTACDKTFTLPTDTINFPQHVALGDLSNDNYPDVAMGGWWYNNGQGRVWLYHNKPPGSTDEPPISLQEAASAGEVDDVKVLLAKGVDVNAREWGSLKTALHYAAEKGHKKVVELLLAKGANINAKDTQGRTPFQRAVRRGEKDIIGFLLAKGADVNSKDKWGYTPLYWAIWNEDKDTIKLLVDKGADVNITPKNDYPPLHYALWNEDVELAKFLVNNGAKFNTKDLDGWTAFRYAVSGGNRELFEFLVAKGADVSKFHMSAWLGDLTSVKRFVEQGTDVNTKDDQLNWTALHWVAFTGHQDVIELLLAKGANVNAKDEWNDVPLHYAAVAGKSDLVGLLLAKEAEVNSKDDSGKTPLHDAATQGHQEVVEMLIAAGADVNAKDQDGRTPLHQAARKGNRDIAELLIAKGADVNVADKDGRAPLSWAQRHEEIFELLRKHEAEEWGNTPLHWAARQGQLDLVLFHIAKGVDVNSKDEAGRTALHLAATYGKKDAVELLIAKGADVNAKDNQGRTALLYAQDKGHTEIIELLRKHGAKE